MDPTATTAPSQNELPDFARKLLHRWFVQYNPIYLLSASLVLGGAILMSRGLAQGGSVYGALGVALVPELYACALIAGAALLTRIEQRRPAVLLALIALLYQADLTFHTETCAYLGTIGAAASLSWFVLFVLKLRALAWALRIKLTGRAQATAILGASLLTVGPHVLPLLSAHQGGTFVALSVFGLATLCPTTTLEAATSPLPLDAWGRTVFRRSVLATWVIWATLLGVHVIFWSSQRRLDLGCVFLALVFVALVRPIRREMHLWTAVLSLLVLVFVVAPAGVSLCALFSALTLFHRAFVPLRKVVPQPSVAPPVSPYRASADGLPPESPSTEATTLVPIDAATRLRLLTGALFGAYFASWSLGYHGGEFPRHMLYLDLLLTAAVALFAWRLRARMVFVPLAIVYADAFVERGLVPRPHSTVEWGVLAVFSGFGLLFSAIAIAYWLARTHRARPTHVPASPP